METRIHCKAGVTLGPGERSRPTLALTLPLRVLGTLAPASSLIFDQQTGLYGVGRLIGWGLCSELVGCRERDMPGRVQADAEACLAVWLEPGFRYQADRFAVGRFARRKFSRKEKSWKNRDRK